MLARVLLTTLLIACSAPRDGNRNEVSLPPGGEGDPGVWQIQARVSRLNERVYESRHAPLVTADRERIWAVLSRQKLPTWLTDPAALYICRYSVAGRTNNGNYVCICAIGPTVVKGGPGGRFGGPSPVVTSVAQAFYVEGESALPIGDLVVRDRDKDSFDEKPWLSLKAVVDADGNDGVYIVSYPFNSTEIGAGVVSYFERVGDRFERKGRRMVRDLPPEPIP